MPKLSAKILPWPADWSALFGAERPLILEIGFGRGQFLLHLAQLNPASNVIGLEISNKCLDSVEQTLLRQQITNVRVVHSTAETALAHLFTPASLTQVHINFPDPWFKVRHGHRRLMQRDTLDLLVNRLAPGGELYLATDIVEYAEMSAELLAATPGLENLLDAPWQHTMPGRVVTKYERKAQREGRMCYYFAYRRNQQPAPPAPQIREFDMPHMVLHSPMTFGAIQEQFQPAVHDEGDTHIRFIHVYQGEKSLLFEVYVKEPTIEQRVAVMLLEHEEHANHYTLHLSPMGHPRPTAGIHRAVSLLGVWLLGLHPETSVLKHTIQPDQINKAQIQ